VSCQLRTFLNEQLELLEQEVISTDARVLLTRHARQIADASHEPIYSYAQIVNTAKQNRHEPIYLLECDDMGDYMAQEHAYFQSSFFLVFRGSSTIQLVQIIADLLYNGSLQLDVVNQILEEDRSKIRYVESGEVYVVELLDTFEESEQELSSQGNHPNLKILLERMGLLLLKEDYSGVLHTSASIFETISKDIIGNPKIENQPFGSFFNAYIKKSKLPTALLDYAKEIYRKRNITPGAGHGGTQLADFHKEDAVIIAEITKACLRIEDQLRKN